MKINLFKIITKLNNTISKLKKLKWNNYIINLNLKLNIKEIFFINFFFIDLNINIKFLINLFFNILLKISLIYEKFYNYLIIQEKINFLYKIKIKIFVFIYEYFMYFIVFCLIFGIFLIILSIIINLNLKFLNYYTLEILPKFFYETHIFLHVLNRRGYPNLDLIYKKYNITDVIEDNILKEKFGSARDKYEHIVLYTKINFILKDFADKYSNITDSAYNIESKRKMDILFQQMTTLNFMLEELKYFFRSPFIINKSHWMHKYDFADLYNKYCNSTDIIDNSFKKRFFLINTLKKKWIPWFSKLKCLQNNDEIIILNSYLKNYYDLSLNDFEIFDNLDSNKFDILYNSLWNNTCRVVDNNNSNSLKIKKLNIINNFFYEFLILKKIIDDIKKEEEIINFYKTYSNNFYNIVENIILFEMSIIEESYQLHFKNLDDVTRRIQKDYDKYIIWWYEPFLRFIFWKIVVPIENIWKKKLFFFFRFISIFVDITKFILTTYTYFLDDFSSKIPKKYKILKKLRKKIKIFADKLFDLNNSILPSSVIIKKWKNTTYKEIKFNIKLWLKKKRY